MTDPYDSSDLGAFLKACRARLHPDDLGLTTYGDQRRVPGLRREEVAHLAGVSASYYARLEQGQSRHASAQVLDAIAVALELDAPERQHLHALANAAGRRRRPRPAPAEHADPALVELLDAVPHVPALILGRRSDVLAWNPLGHALLAGHREYAAHDTPDRRVNMTELIFLDPDTRDLYADWRDKARAVVGNLRLVAGSHPDDPALAALIGRLTMASPEFSALWADHRVQPCATARYRLKHPLVGELTVTQLTLRSAEHPDQTLVTHTVPPGEANDALTMLAHLAPGAQPVREARSATAARPFLP